MKKNCKEERHYFEVSVFIYGRFHQTLKAFLVIEKSQPLDLFLGVVYWVPLGLAFLIYIFLREFFRQNKVILFVFFFFLLYICLKVITVLDKRGESEIRKQKKYCEIRKQKKY